MGYPVITRVGINQFWYRHWYTDTFYRQNAHQDRMFEKFVMLYVDYGTIVKNNVFIHEYWYSKSSKTVRTAPIKSYAKHYRKQYYTNLNLTIEHSFLLRKHSGEYFPMRCWILKYGKWIIISLKIFKPLKTKKPLLRDRSKKTGVSSSSTELDCRFDDSIRLKLFYSYMTKKFSNINSEYTF